MFAVQQSQPTSLLTQSADMSAARTVLYQQGEMRSSQLHAETTIHTVTAT